MNLTYMHIHINDLIDNKYMTCLPESVRDKNRETEREGEKERKNIYFCIDV